MILRQILKETCYRSLLVVSHRAMSSPCSKCGKSVYLAERVRVHGRDYHPQCFNCVECGTKLQKGQQLEHETDLFCKNCHGKKFGTVVHDGKNVGGAKVAHTKGEKKEVKKLELDIEDDLLDEEELKLLQSILNPEVEKSALEKMQLGSGNNCAKCGKVVGHAEEVRKAHKVFHKHCYTCTNCDSRLAKGDELEHEGDWFCSNCYRKLYATKTFGFGTFDDLQNTGSTVAKKEL